MQGDYAELIFEVKNINKTIRDIVKVRKEIEKTGKETKNLQDTLVSGWSFGKVFQAMQKFGDAFRDVQVTMRSFSSVYGSFNQRADNGVKMLINDFQETERSAKKLLNLLGSRTINLGLDPDEFTKINVELARITQEISAATGLKVEEVGKKLSQSLAGEVGGLKDLGIIINSSSRNFKDAVSKLQQTGITEEAAKAMVIFGQIQQQTKKFDGSFKEGAKSISQAFGNIQNTLTSGAFAKAGESLSKMLVPILNTIDKILANDIVAHLTGITLAVGSLTVAVLLLKKAVGGFSEFIGLSGLLSKGGGLLAKLAPGLTKAIMGLVPVITSALAGVGAALVAALPYILAAALAAGLTVALVKTVQLIKQKGFAGAAKAIGEWFTGLGESIVNWFKGKGFKSNKELQAEVDEKKSAEMAKKLEELKAKLNANLDEINAAYKDFMESFTKNAGFNFFVKESKVSAGEVKANMRKAASEVEKKLLENQGIFKLLGSMQDGLASVSRTILSSLKTQNKTDLYDTIAEYSEKFKKEFEDMGIDVSKFKRRIDETGKVQVDEKAITQLFQSAGFEKDFLKIREFILKKYVQEVNKWKFVKSQANRAGAPNVKVPSEDEIKEQLGISKTHAMFEAYTKELFEKGFEAISDDEFMDLGTKILEFQSRFKDIYEKVKKNYGDWTLDVGGMELDKFRELTKSDKFRVQLAELLKAIGDQTIANIDAAAKTQEEFWKNRATFIKLVNEETSALKEWRKDKWDIISNSYSTLENFHIPGIDNLSDKLKNQISKINDFKNMFKIDDILKGVKIPDAKNAEMRINRMRDELTNNLSLLSKLTEKPLEELQKMSKEDISSLVKKITQKTYEGFKSEEDLFKKSMDPYTEKEKISLLKELQQHYMDKFHIEMEGLEKERQYIEETNDFIKQTLATAMEWKAQGISAIQSNTMEGYKFMTSGYGALGNFSSVINQKNNEEAVLQKQTNELIKGTKTLIDSINNRLNELIGNAPTLTFVN